MPFVITLHHTHRNSYHLHLLHYEAHILCKHCLYIHLFLPKCKYQMPIVPVYAIKYGNVYVYRLPIHHDHCNENNHNLSLLNLKIHVSSCPYKIHIPLDKICNHSFYIVMTQFSSNCRILP